MPFGGLFDLQRRQIKPREGLDYTEIGVRSFGRGLFVKPTVSAEDIGTKRVFEIHPDDLVISNIFAWEGAVALADARHMNTIGSHRFMTWTPKDDSVDVRYAAAYLTSPGGIASLRAASPGSAGRNRTLSITKLQAIEIPVPEHKEQMRLIRALSLLQHAVTGMERRATLAAALLPAARKEEFSRLIAQAR